VVERFELMVTARTRQCLQRAERSIEQRERFEEQARLMERGDDERCSSTRTFSGHWNMECPHLGIGIGVDRLCMLMTNQPSIQDVLLFPQMRPERTPEQTVGRGRKRKLSPVFRSDAGSGI